MKSLATEKYCGAHPVGLSGKTGRLIFSKSFRLKHLLLILFLLPFLCEAQLKGKVVKVADGDSFTLLVNETQIKVRLHGIDCPEKGQDFSDAAKQALAEMIAGKEVEVKAIDTDRYGRTVGMVTIGNINVNEALLKKGLAWHYTAYDKNPAWAKLEADARLAKLNIWSKKDPMAPWEWRNKRKKINSRD